MKRFRWKYIVLISVCCVQEANPQDNETIQDPIIDEMVGPVVSTEETVY